MVASRPIGGRGRAGPTRLRPPNDPGRARSGRALRAGRARVAQRPPSARRRAPPRMRSARGRHGASRTAVVARARYELATSSTRPRSRASAAARSIVASPRPGSLGSSRLPISDRAWQRASGSAERLRQLERPDSRPPGGVVVACSREDEREARVRECELTPRRQLLEKVDGLARQFAELPHLDRGTRGSSRAWRVSRLP